MTDHQPTPTQQAASDSPAIRGFGIRRPDGQWYIDHGPDGHRWGEAETAGIWITRQHAELALPALAAALRPIQDLPFDVDALVVAQRPSPTPGNPRNPWVRDFDVLRLTTIGSRGLGIAVTPSPFDENADGAMLWLELHDGRLALALTATEGRRLADWLIAVIDSTSR